VAVGCGAVHESLLRRLLDEVFSKDMTRSKPKIRVHLLASTLFRLREAHFDAVEERALLHCTEPLLEIGHIAEAGALGIGRGDVVGIHFIDAADLQDPELSLERAARPYARATPAAELQIDIAPLDGLQHFSLDQH
jgi:hypothetical protein